MIRHGFQLIYFNLNIPNNNAHKLFDSKYFNNFQGIKSKNELPIVVGILTLQISVGNGLFFKSNF